MDDEKPKRIIRVIGTDDGGFWRNQLRVSANTGQCETRTENQGPGPSFKKSSEKPDESLVKGRIFVSVQVSFWGVKNK